MLTEEIITAATSDINSSLVEGYKKGFINSSQISDGYHTFGELYAHRFALWIALCALQAKCSHEVGYSNPVWRSKTHSDGSVWDGWFLLGINHKAGEQMTYHLPISEWDKCNLAVTLDRAPDWDGHTAANVLERIKTHL